MASLYAISRELGFAHSRDLLLEIAERHLHEVFAVRVAALLPGPDGSLEAARADEGTLDAADKDLGVAEWVWLHQRPAGTGTDTLPSARALFVPLKGARGRVGVLALYPSPATRLGDPDERQLLDTFAGLVGSALERTQLADEARRAHLRAETEQLRNSLLSSVSHDLRTPLAVVTGATSALLDEHGPKDESQRRESAADGPRGVAAPEPPGPQPARHDAARGGSPQGAEGAAAARGGGGRRAGPHGGSPARARGAHAASRRISRSSRSTPALIEQVLINLLENATKYTPPGTPIEISAHAQDGTVGSRWTIADPG